MEPNVQLIDCIESCLTKTYGHHVTILSMQPVSGGDINRAYCLRMHDGNMLMMKLNSNSAYPNMFELESRGLDLIRNTHTIAVPNVVLQAHYADHSFLLMEWIDSTKPSASTSALLGQQLAAMHRHTAARFGLGHDNYMGSLQQSNRMHNTWAEFFINERLQPMVQTAVNKQLLSNVDVKQFDRLYNIMSSLFEEEAPALIHGDLWGGNYLIANNGMPFLIDPAVSYGNREFDIAMTTLFGGFDKPFYDAYNEGFPLAHAWQQRLDLWNLYPLLLHLNLFGGGYLGQVKSCLQKYV
ncbi:fructosamine kinase family protein [Mucilaginibacter sp. PAMB04168]|uniref:fructosamine kinase family protein n=1 Tax=Mucilaginibacter sp. PAMB04168 TaxID=3138567 RepID=UPI0031F71CE3